MSGPDVVSTSPLTRSALSSSSADSSGRLDAFEGVVADVRPRRALEHELRDETKPRHGLPSSVIHELRTPLTSIHGYAQVLQRNLANPSRANNALSVISRESVKLTEMLALLSELSELESDEPTSQTFQVNLRQIVEGVIHDVERRDGGQHRFSLEGDGLARCNPNVLSRALLHVLTNAVRYSDSGQDVVVAISERRNHVEIVVSDRGIGLVPGERERIFRPFTRGSNAREHGVRGLGLGLYLAREALYQTGGEINAEPGPGGGTRFCIRLPQG